MWVTDLLIEAQRRRKAEILPRPKREKKSGLMYLDIDRLLKNQQMRRIKERK